MCFEIRFLEYRPLDRRVCYIVVEVELGGVPLLGEDLPNVVKMNIKLFRLVVGLLYLAEILSKEIVHLPLLL